MSVCLSVCLSACLSVISDATDGRGPVFPTLGPQVSLGARSPWCPPAAANAYTLSLRVLQICSGALWTQKLGSLWRESKTTKGSICKSWSRSQNICVCSRYGQEFLFLVLTSRFIQLHIFRITFNHKVKWVIAMNQTFYL